MHSDLPIQRTRDRILSKILVQTIVSSIVLENAGDHKIDRVVNSTIRILVSVLQMRSVSQFGRDPFQ